MSKILNVEEVMRENGIIPGTEGNRYEPNVAEITATVDAAKSGNANAVVTPSGEMISSIDPELIELQRTNPDMVRIMQILKDMKKSH